MRILIISDSHGNIDDVLRKIKTMEKSDMLFHLGDYVEDGIRLKEQLNIPTIIVRGNGDQSRTDFNDDELVEIKGKKIFLTHGHKYDVRFDILKLYYKAQEVGADYILFGHTHVPIIERVENTVIMNPGSPFLPRGYNKKKTFGMIIIGSSIEEKIIEIN